MFHIIGRLVRSLDAPTRAPRSPRTRLSLDQLEGREVPAGMFNVDTTADTDDANPGDGVALDANGKVSLRAAVQEANALGGNDTYLIGFAIPRAATIEDPPPPPHWTIPLRTAMATFTANIWVSGDGWNTHEIVGGADDKGMFSVAATSTSTISGVTLANGVMTGSGGAVTNQGTLLLSAVKITGCTADYGGAISNSSQLRVVNSWIEGNTARGGPGGRGGGIAGQGKSTALVTGTQILSNTADSRGGGVAVLDTARVELQDTGLISNSANYGGGAYNSGGTFVMGGGTIGSNTVSTNGGGLEHAGGTTALTGVTIQNNTAGETGGGVYIGSGTLFMTGGTLQDNSAQLGGSVYQTGGSATFQGVTIQNNVASLWGGAASIEAGSMSFTTCTFAGNDALLAPLIARVAKNQPTVTVAADCQGINPNTDIVDI